jgi:hypothetical protein
MPQHSDRRATLRWGKSGPPRSGCPGQPRGGVASLDRVPDPPFAPLLATGLLRAITADQPNQDRL